MRFYNGRTVDILIEECALSGRITYLPFQSINWRADVTRNRTMSFIKSFFSFPSLVIFITVLHFITHYGKSRIDSDLPRNRSNETCFSSWKYSFERLNKRLASAIGLTIPTIRGTENWLFDCGEGRN